MLIIIRNSKYHKLAGGTDKLVQSKPIYVLTVYLSDGAVKVTGAISFLTLCTEGEYTIRNPIQ
jgi:hypothetical protein